VQGFRYDEDALERCDALVMVQPCGRSAALELGWAAGAGKPTIVLLADGEPELMLKMAQHFCLTVEEVLQVLASLSPEVGDRHLT
jgi:nucleoside 2-deoxyribosyltransferase